MASRTLPHIQNYLDRRWPGVRLEWNGEYGYWIITDYVSGPDGKALKQVRYKTPANMRGIYPTEYTNRKLLFLLSHPDTGAAIKPSYFNVISTLSVAYVGGSEQAWDAFLDRLEEGEDAEEKRKEDEIRDGTRSAWSASEGARKNRVISSSAGVTCSEKAQSFIASQLKQQSAQDSDMVTAAQRRLAVRRAIERFKQRANPDN
jgi:hypothetical protein